MINLDTEQLKSLLAQLESANNQIDSAMNCLQRVTTHSSWGCAERNTINEHILENRQQMQRIQQDSESFLNATRAVTDDFCAAENDISGWFSSVDEAISQVISIRPRRTEFSVARVVAALEKIRIKHPPVIRPIGMKIPWVRKAVQNITVVGLKNVYF